MDRLYHGDCLEIMPTLEAGSIDAIITDLPYGTTDCKWDAVIPFSALWRTVKHVLKPHGVFITTASQPFTSALIMSNPNWYRHQWVWNKNNSAGFATAKTRPFAICEDVLVFGEGKVNYYPQMEERGTPRIKGGYSSSDNYNITPSKSRSNTYYPKNLINISNASQVGKIHSTQKPVSLYEYLIKTYTNKGDTVLDMTMGSGTTGVACKNTGRNFIGIEISQEYLDIAKERIK